MPFWSDGLGRKVGFRYLRAKKSSSFLSLITTISIGGVAVGVLTLIVTLSVMSGFESELKKRLFAAETHVLIENDEGYFRADDVLLGRIQSSFAGITHVFPVLQTEVIMRSGNKVSGGVFKGVNDAQFKWLDSHVTERAPDDFLAGFGPESRLYMGQEMAFEIAVVPGDRVTVVSPVETEGPLGAVPRVKKFVVAGVYKTGIPEQELHVVFAPIAGVESFLHQSGFVNQIEVRLSRFEDAGIAAEKTRALVESVNPAFSARSWQELNAHLFRSLRLERTAMFCILIFIIVVASFNIVSTLTMMVTEKKLSLSILRAMGATPAQIGNVFLWEGFAIGGVGILLGLVTSLLICWGLRKFPLIELPDFYYDRTLPVVVSASSVVWVVVVTLAVVLLGAVIPSRRASRMSPIDGINEA